jgi:hypothetical protein
MSSDTPPKMPIELIPSVQNGVSALASHQAPFLYFDEAPTFGHLNGVIRVTLIAVRDMPLPEGKVGSDRVIVGHLRMSIHAARALKAALEGALFLAAPAESQSKN